MSFFFFSFSTISLAQLGQENAHSEDLFVADDWLLRPEMAKTQEFLILFLHFTEQNKSPQGQPPSGNLLLQNAFLYIFLPSSVKNSDGIFSI